MRMSHMRTCACVSRCRAAAGARSPMNKLTLECQSGSHRCMSRTWPSQPPDTSTHSDSGDQCRAQMFSRCPVSVWVNAPVPISHNRTWASSPAAAMRQWADAVLDSASVCTRDGVTNVAACWSSSVSQTCTILPVIAVRTSLSSCTIFLYTSPSKKERV